MQKEIREMQRQLKQLGFIPKSCSGSHQKWVNGKCQIVVPIVKLKKPIQTELNNFIKRYRKVV